MGKTKKIYTALSIVITAVFLAIGLFCCSKSYARLWETIGELCSSIKFYFCEIFGIENSTQVEVITPSEILQGEVSIIPKTSSTFCLKFKVYFTLLVNGTTLDGYFKGIFQGIGNFSKVLVLIIPIVFLAVIIIKKIYALPNTKHNQDTRALKAFKKLSGATYQPLRRFIIRYRVYLENNPKWKTAWLCIWLANINFFSIAVAFISYYFYFAVSFDIPSLYPQVVNLLKDLLLVLRYFPYVITGTVAWYFFTRMRENIGLNILQYHEARDCGFIKELPIVTMTCAPMGMKKTTLTTDMALSQTVMFRQEAFDRLQKQDMKFPFFGWIAFEMDIRACMEHGVIYNLASIHTWIEKKRNRYEKHKNANLQLYGYDVGRYGLKYDNGLKREYLFEVMETYAKLYFIYVIESSLLVSNYSIRVDFVIYDMGNFPLWNYNFFPQKYPVHSRYAHILDFDVLRLGKKVVENNPNAGSFEFGVVVITEIGKERANNLELKEMKKNADEANQKNDLFNAWLKMCRHAATVDNFPFIKVFCDEQRPESWGADARDLADILTITNSGKQKLALPFYTIEEMITEWCYNKFKDLYYDFRHRRGDNTLFVHLLKCIVSKLYARNERIYNRFGYCVVSLERERGTQDGKKVKKRYFLANYKIYRERFKTDCFADYFNELADLSGIGLLDYMEYGALKASVEELKQQNSYFINGLYGI